MVRLVTSEPATRSMSSHWVAIFVRLTVSRAIGSSGPYPVIAARSVASALRIELSQDNGRASTTSFNFA
jgi:hypothetical protein